MNSLDPQIGMSILIMVRHDGITYITGEVVGVNPTHVAMNRCVWHRQTGRHGEFFAEPSLLKGRRTRASRYTCSVEQTFPGMSWTGPATWRRHE